jgi:phosphopantothenoylcysteine decarboxylase/phosphopantothenate--cysteine ligase
MAIADPFAGKRILVAVSGSIAAVKVPQLVSALVQRGAEVRCLLTPSAGRLVSAVALASLSRHPCLQDADEWNPHQPRPLHIELAEWAQLVVLAPLTASTMARLVHGLADNLLASTLLACGAPRLYAAAMNTQMWQAPAVQRNWRQLLAEPSGLALAPASEGLLACDSRGAGRMLEPALLLLAAESLLLHGPGRDLQGRRILVTAGPTREALDPARFLSNPSTGLMGVLLAQAARLRGAEVRLLHGPLALDPALLEGLQCTAFVAAAELEQALGQQQAWAEAVLMAAAVADQRLRQPLAHKSAKQDLQQLMLAPDSWEPVPDLMKQLVQRRPAGQQLLGFAAHTGDLLAQAEPKLVRKGCDLLFVNPIDQPEAGFGSAINQGWLLQVDGPAQCIAPASKLAIAHQLLDAVARRLT